MVATQRTQSLTDFRQKATETLDRLNQTGEAEIITVNGQARAVLLAPAVYDELAKEVELARDVTAIRKSMKQFEDGKGIPIKQAHEQLRSELLAMKAQREGQQTK